jgi:hypothetical protein
MAASHFRCRRFRRLRHCYDDAAISFSPPYSLLRDAAAAMPLSRCCAFTPALRHAPRDATRRCRYAFVCRRCATDFQPASATPRSLFQAISPPPSRFAADISAISFHSLCHFAILFAFSAASFHYATLAVSRRFSIAMASRFITPLRILFAMVH